MPRPTRIQYENAFYHVMNRGRGRCTIFHGDDYYRAFLDTVAEAHKRFSAKVHAYCLMSNHYHLLVETPLANLDRIMRHINGVYTQRYNRLKKTDGPLFRGRYKAILVDEDAYLLQLSRYIHRNPAEAKGVSDHVLDDYQWSSYRAYINKASPEPWLNREKIYGMLGTHQKYSRYHAFVASGVDEDIKRFYSKGNVATVLGDKDFKSDIHEQKDAFQILNDTTPSVLQSASIDEILSAVAQVFDVPLDSIRERSLGRQEKNIPRKLAMYYCFEKAGVSLGEIAKIFGLKGASSVSSALHTIKKRIASGELSEVMNRMSEMCQ